MINKNRFIDDFQGNSSNKFRIEDKKLLNSSITKYLDL